MLLQVLLFLINQSIKKTPPSPLSMSFVRLSLSRNIGETIPWFHILDCSQSSSGCKPGPSVLLVQSPSLYPNKCSEVLSVQEVLSIFISY